MEEKKLTAKEKLAKHKEFCKENNWPCFVPPSGKCFSCHQEVFSDGDEGPAYDDYITGCPHCCRTFCD